MDELGHLNQHPGLTPPAFSAKVVEYSEEWLRLDRTFFYPMGGGQPADHGIVSGDGFSCQIHDVRGREGVLHHFEIVEGDVALSDVDCSIDSERRNSLCKMHSAQHLFSAIAHDTWGAITVGNQIGVDRTRIDLQFEDRDAFDSIHLQDLVNDAISSNLPIGMEFRDRKELIADPRVRVNLDRMPANIDVLRTISIGELDVCPCAGTHVSSTGQIPNVAVSKVKSKGAGKLRVEYLFN